MEIKPRAETLKIIPGTGGVIVQKDYGPQHEGAIMDPPYVFTDMEALHDFLYNYFCDTEAELKKRARESRGE